jgi:hypothetical protein
MQFLDMKVELGKGGEILSAGPTVVDLLIPDVFFLDFLLLLHLPLLLLEILAQRVVVEHFQPLPLFRVHVDLLAQHVGCLGCSLVVDVQIVVVEGIVALPARTYPHSVSIRLSSLLFLSVLDRRFCGFCRLSHFGFGKRNFFLNGLF